MTKAYLVKNSPIHGKGVFAARNIRKGAKIIEYVGLRIPNEAVDDRLPSDPNDLHHTFFFELSDGKTTIDASEKGNAARWINHSCAPNCVSDEEQDKKGEYHVYIYAQKDIKKGAELNYDYRLTWDGRMTKQDRLNHECRCGAPTCRGTMLWIDPKVLKAEKVKKLAAAAKKKSAKKSAKKATPKKAAKKAAKKATPKKASPKKAGPKKSAPKRTRKK